MDFQGLCCRAGLLPPLHVTWFARVHVWISRREHALMSARKPLGMETGLLSTKLRDVPKWGAQNVTREKVSAVGLSWLERYRYAQLLIS